MAIEEILDGLRQADKLADILEQLLDELFDARCVSGFGETVDADEAIDSMCPAVEALTDYRKSKGE